MEIYEIIGRHVLDCFLIGHTPRKHPLSMRRVCEDLFPRERRRAPRTLPSVGYLGSAAGIPWSAPGVSERISKRPSQARPWAVHKRTRPNEAVHGKRLRKRNRLGTDQFEKHLHQDFVYSRVDAVPVCKA